MTPFRLDRRRQADDDVWLGHKMMVFLIGSLFGVLGMATDRAWMIYVAIVLLAAGLLLRLWGRRRSRLAQQDEEEDQEPPGEHPVDGDPDVPRP
jgi:protein-S-isoprenylcysteine O-methyltransferase Ste14